jgi:hypothetical protein
MPALYRALRHQGTPHAPRRSDCGRPRILPHAALERYSELTAAIKLRTSNRQGQHGSTAGAIRFSEDCGLETPDAFVQAPKELLKTPPINRYLKQWGYDWPTLRREPPAVGFQVCYSNECCQFDVNPSDLKEIKEPRWLEAARGPPTLLNFA